jgi:hypothetical protein
MKDATGQLLYTSQKDLDNEVRSAYTCGSGIKRIQTEIFEPIGLHPSKRAVENYLNDLGIELRKRARATPKTEPDTSAELAQAKANLEIDKIERESKDVRIAEMQQTSLDDAATILRLKARLRDFRDMGRAPTDAEIEEIV